MSNFYCYKDRFQSWKTPSDLYSFLLNEFNLIDFNPCIYEDFKNSLLLPYNNYFCNPPFNNIEPFVDYMINNNSKGFKSFLLLPIRLNTNWFIKLINYGCDFIILGRLKYSDLGFAPFDSMLVILNHNHLSRFGFTRDFKNFSTIKYIQTSIFDF